MDSNGLRRLIAKTEKLAEATDDRHLAGFLRALTAELATAAAALREAERVHGIAPGKSGDGR